MDAVSHYIQDYLYKLRLSNDCACSLCSDYNETIMHLFFHCEKAKTFWAKLKTLVKSRLNYDICISAPNIIFGHLSYGDLFIPLNAIYMAAKMYIFECAQSRNDGKYEDINRFTESFELIIPIRWAIIPKSHQKQTRISDHS